MNRPFVFAVLTLLIIISAIVYIPNLIDGNRYRDFLASRMSDVLNIPVRIEGAVDISLFPSQSLLINNITIGNPELIEDISATIEVLQVDLIISSLFSNFCKLIINFISLVTLKILHQYYKDKNSQFYKDYILLYIQSF